MVECDGMLTASDNASKLTLQSVYYTYNHSENINQQQQKREPSLWITGNINMIKQMHKWPQGSYNYATYCYAKT